MEKVTIKNIGNRKIGFVVSELRINRTIMPGRTMLIEREKLEEALTFPGIEGLFARKYIAIVEPEVGVEMGVVDEESIVTDSEGKMKVEGTEDFEEIKRILSEGTDFQTKKLFNSANSYRNEVIVAAAYEVPNISANKKEIIKTFTGVDMFKNLD